jgi:hypothetical protein
MRRLIFPTVVAVSLLSNPSAFAGPLERAEVTKIINKVSVVDPRIGGRPALLRDVIKDDLGLETGKKSRSELLFQDNTLTRFGAETFFSFKTGTRDMTLEKGSMLLQVPKGLGGAEIHTGAVTAAITGTTIMIDYSPHQYIKVLVLEGSLRLSRNGVFGDSLILRPGKMVIMQPDAKKIPEPVDVDLAHIVETSSLVNFPDAEPLPSMSLIQSAINQQQSQIANTKLVPTNLVMGQGTNVIVASSAQLAKLVSPTGLLGATLSGTSIVNTKLGLPLVGGTVTTLTTPINSVATAIDPIVATTTNTLGSVANDLLGTATTTVSSLPVASSTQLVSLLDTAIPTSTGTALVAPAVNAVSTTAAAVTNTVTSTTSIVTGPTSTSSAPTTTSTLSTITPTTAAVLGTVTAPTTILTPLTTTTQTTSANLLSLGQKH